MLVTSFEDTSISKLVVGKARTHSWVYDFTNGKIEEVLNKNRIAPFQTCSAILPGEKRVVISAILKGEERIFTANLDGSDPVELTRAGEGFSYGVDVNPAGERIAFHVTDAKQAKKTKATWFKPGHYCINTIGVDGTDRGLVAGKEGHLFFGPIWSPNGAWLAFLDCLYLDDPAHFWADIWISREDGTGQMAVTTGQSHWFGTTFGTKENRGGGSNITRWSPDGNVLAYTRVAPGSHPDCEFHPENPDHLECEYNPGMAKGGSQICTINPFTGELNEVTEIEESRWDFRATFSPDGKKLVFTRAWVNHSSEIWIANLETGNQKLLTKGMEGKGADFGKWL